MINSYLPKSTLVGKRVVITRAIHQSPALETLLRQYQAIPIVYPCIAIVPPADTSQLDRQLINLVSYDWLIVTSSNTIHALKERLTALDLHPDWEQIKVAVVGDKTAQAFISQFKHEPNFIPDIFTAEALAETLPIKSHGRVFLPQSALADNTLSKILSGREAEVISVTAYETVLGEGGEDVPEMLEQGTIDVLTFTSSSTVENFLRRIYPLSCPDLPALCIGTSTADSAKQLGFQQIITPDGDFTLQGMINALICHYDSRLY